MPTGLSLEMPTVLKHWHQLLQAIRVYDNFTIMPFKSYKSSRHNYYEFEKAKELDLLTL